MGGGEGRRGPGKGDVASRALLGMSCSWHVGGRGRGGVRICLLVAEIENVAWEARKGGDMVAAGAPSSRMSTTPGEAVGHARCI